MLVFSVIREERYIVISKELYSTHSYVKSTNLSKKATEWDGLSGVAVRVRSRVTAGACKGEVLCYSRWL